MAFKRHSIVRPPFHIARRVSVQYTPTQLAAKYNFPTSYNGAGQTVGIIELGGGFDQANLQAYFTQLGLKTPSVVSVPVAGGSNTEDGPSGADGEVQLDIEVAGAIAPGATFRVYFAPNSGAGFLAALQQARADGCSVISMSWGGPEDSWPASDQEAMSAEFATGAAAGISYFAASGDNLSGDGENGEHVDFPASNLNVTACGGTSTLTSATGALAESVWNSDGGGTGGGISIVFPAPVYQSGIKLPGQGRAVPDVAGNADPETGYSVLIDGQPLVIGGTSAVAPLYAALAAILNQAMGKRVGPWNPILYRLASQGAFPGVDVVIGNNGAYTAGIGYDCCTGLGRIDGAKFLAALQGTSTPTPTPIPTPTPVPTPTPTPPPPPPPPPPGPPLVQQTLDRVLAALIAAFARRWDIDALLVDLKQIIDQYFAQNPGSTLSARQVWDAACRVLEQQAVQSGRIGVVFLLQEIQAYVDTLLPA